MKNKYLITLTPLGNYYFGGEVTFGDPGAGKNKNDNENKLNYLVQGTPFPQQTTILGMLRYELLRKAGLLAPKHRTTEAINLIGSNGFDPGNRDGYGIISRIFPVFITTDKQAKIPHRLLQQEENSQGMSQLKYTSVELINGNGSCLVNYDAKHKINEEYSDPKGTSMVQFSDIFDVASQVGIKKNYQGNTEENAFFKQTFYRLKKGYSFAFYAEFTVDPGFESGVIFMGGDQSLFKFEIAPPVEKSLFCELDEINETIPDNSGEADNYEIILMSDCKVEDSVLNIIQHSVNQVQDFRYIVTHANTTGFASFNNKNGLQKKQEKHELLSRNSVLFVKGNDNLLKVMNSINSEKAFRNIGYNFYKIIKKQR